MPRAAKASGSGVSSNQELPFEEALKKLESIVESMESDDLPLEKLLAQFEEGTRLAEHCQAKLSEAELTIQKLDKNSEGEPVLKEFKIDGGGSDDRNG